MSTRADLLKIFSPAKELQQPDRFAGRESEVLKLTDALQVEGSCLLIYGHRGLGKSSLAVQIDRIAQGDVTLLEELGKGERVLAEDDWHLVLWVTCTEAVKNLDHLLQLIINGAEDVVAASASDGASGASRLMDRTTRRKVSIKPFELETVKRYETESKRTSHQDLSATEKTVRLRQLLTDVYQQPVLVVVDELDLVKKTNGLGSFIKAHSTAALKFLLVGIGNTISDLLADHRSVQR